MQMDKKQLLSSSNRRFHLEKIVPESQTHHYLILIIRFVISIFLVLSAINILSVYTSFAQSFGEIKNQGFFIDNELTKMVDILPDFLNLAIGYALPWLLLVLGVLLLIGLFTRITSITMAMLMIPILYHTGIFYAEFTHAFVPLNKDILILGCLIGIAVSGPGRYSIDVLLSREDDMRGSK